ncbi:efflux RND transporter periplasmic adaptor subunit [Formosa sp. S-31]|uniref:efflux RND transporter periplasmic adaptor subunit n=1 Tax=Formosa sp. S-31 TaxID=2790949 RepID=UPI003EBE0E46
MNKSSIYIVLALLAGLGLGYFIFGKTSETPKSDSENKETLHGHGVEKWTCSMHPQIFSGEPGNCPICGMTLIPMEQDAEGVTAQQFKLTKNAEALANITTTTIGSSTAPVATLVLSGTITENADKVYVQPAHFNGRIERLYITSVGQEVRKGQLVASIYSPELIKAQQELITAYKLKSAQPKLYEAVKAKFKNWMITDAQLDDIVKSGELKEQFKIYSHVSGTVSEISVNEGDHIMDAKAIFKVADLSTVWAEFDAYENQIAFLKTGQTLEMRSKAFGDNTVKAKIDFIDPVLNANTRTVKVRVVLNNTKGMWRPGMFVEGQLQDSNVQEDAAISLPASAVLWTGKRSVVYVKVQPDAPVFEMRNIELGTKTGETYRVISGLQAGDVVVTHGAFTVDAAAQLQGKTSMMNQSDSSQRTKKTMTFQEKGSVEPFVVPKTFRKEINKLLEGYLEFKDALVADDFEASKKAAKSLKLRLEQIDLKSVQSNTDILEYVNEMKSMMLSELGHVETSSDITMVRQQFLVISNQMQNMLEHFGTDKTVYVQFCPMANANAGGYWLSLEEDIRNPYFGAAMLTCGENNKILGKK